MNAVCMPSGLNSIMLIVHWDMLWVMMPMFNIREGTIQAIISRDPVPRLSRKVTMPAKKLLLVLMKSLV